ncbi:uncharacterized protein LOC105767196 [Gossypium raimondii]|uniref:uncharacterized protein LOC105767196 n=1 Tax=Gossypium raimondii TaxID=29730 RepID=UPI00063A88AB|nr:uncharacterized protein LOC105767196 [Gossypium raimondii]
MKTFLQALDLWSAVENDVEPPPLRANPTIAQIRQHGEERAKKHKAMACLQNRVSDVIFTHIMACDSPKQAWDRLKEEFMGSDKTRQQQVINLRREFENLKMKESETIKQYSDRIMTTVNNIRLLGEDFSDSRVVEKVITTLPEREEQVGRRRVLKVLFKQRSKKALAQVRKLRSLGLKKGKDQRKMLYGHHEKICRNQEKAQTLPVQAKTAEDLQAQEEHVFTASCSATTSKSKCSWLVDSGCSHHMESDESLFKDLDKSYTSKVKIGNGNLIEAKGRGDVVINTGSVFKNDSCVINDVLGREVVLAPMADSCFMLDVSQLERRAYTSSVDNADLWHRRFGHVNFRSLNLLHKMSLIEDMIKVDANESVCEDGIHHQLTTVYTPQQNGVCKRKNRTVMNMTRCLLFQSKLSSIFWAEGVNTSVYLLNRLPTHAVKDKTPFEAWYDFKPTVSHLKVFGCMCFVLVPAERRTKLEKRSVPGIFIGYSSSKKGYRVFDPSTNKVLVSRDVKIDEGRFWSLDGSNTSQFEEEQVDSNLELAESEVSNANVDDAPVRGTRSIADIY